MQKSARVKSSGQLEPAERILAAGRELFFEYGFGGVSTDKLAKHAATSKSSIYKYFGNMQGVLYEVIRREADAFEIGVNTKPETADELVLALSKYGEALLVLLNKPEIIQFDRLMHEQARNYPEVAGKFYQLAYGRSHQYISDLIRFGIQQQLLMPDISAELLGEHLLCMWEGLSFIRARLGLAYQVNQEPANWAKHCVLVLLQPRFAT